MLPIRMQVEAAAQKVEDAWGRIDIWVNDAMATIFSPFMEITPEEFKRATEVTYLGFVWGTRSALKRMMPRDKGHHRAGWLGARLPLDSLAGALLRSQTCHGWLYR